MKIFKHIKKFGGVIVAGGVGLVIDSLLKSNIPAPRSFWKRMLMKVGIAAIASYAVKKAVDSFEDDVDQAEEAVMEIVKDVEEMKEFSK